MKIKFNEHTSGEGYIVECNVVDKGLLDTDKIFIHKSSDDSFVKIASLNDLILVPGTRDAAEYYRKNYCKIISGTASEAAAIKDQLSDQFNSLALEFDAVKEFYSAESKVTYPIIILHKGAECED